VIVLCIACSQFAGQNLGRENGKQLSNMARLIRQRLGIRKTKTAGILKHRITKKRLLHKDARRVTYKPLSIDLYSVRSKGT
jgi:hypothetical protein